MYVVEKFARYAVATRTRPIAPEALHHAKRAIIDWHAALFPGAVVAPATLLEKALAEDLDRGNARLALGRRGSTRAVALINGTASHTLEVDDIFKFGIYHPGAPTISAALAAAQSAAASGEALVRAVIVGYEISTRIGAAMGRAHYKYWHNTGTVGTFGAAAAASEIYGLDAKRFSHALATSATFAAALQQAFRMDSMSKPLHAGHAAEAGILAAAGAREGVTGSLDVIEGETGFGRAMSDGPDWDKALETLGKTHHVTMMTFKNHACCGHTFAAIDGAQEAQRQLGAKPADIARIKVGSYRAAKEVSGYENPATPAEARFSLKYVVANALVHGSVRLAAFEPACMNDKVTRGLMQKIEVVIDPELDAAFPNQRAARVAIETRDGHRAEYLQAARKGDPELPMSDADLEGKYLELAAPVLGDATARSLVARLWKLEGIANVATGLA